MPGRKVTDGKFTGLKQDKFRHSEFEKSENDQELDFGGISHKSINTLGGVGAENRGWRGDRPRNHRFNQDTPFENGRVTNWGNRKGWEPYFYERTRHGGAWRGPDIQPNHYGKGPVGYRRSDEMIFEDACEMLTLCNDVDATNMEVDVRNGIIYLRGFVPNRYMKRRAEEEIEDISGVLDVQNQLSLKGEEDGIQ
jgi:hypothetical protein